MDPRRKRILVTAAVAATLLGGATWLGPWRFSDPPLSGRENLREQGEDFHVSPDPGEPNAPDAPSAGLLPGAVLRLETEWQDCPQQDPDIRVQSVDAGLVGSRREELADRFPGWRLHSFHPEAAHLVRSVPGGCPDEETVYTLGLRGDHVVIVRGIDPEGPVVQETGISAAQLLPGDRNLLRGGVTVVGEDLAWQFLEGVTEHLNR